MLELLLPTTCAGCGAADTAWCSVCSAALGTPRPVRTPLLVGAPEVYAIGPYRAAVRRAVLAYKERGRRDLTTALAEPLARALLRLPSASPDGAGRWWVVPAPSRPGAARARGGAHMLRLARAVTGDLSRAGIPAVTAPCLRMCGQVRDSVGLAPAERVRNLAGNLEPVRSEVPPVGTPVVLLDDVVTTGATAASCAAVLQREKLRPVAVLAVAAAGGRSRPASGLGTTLSGEICSSSPAREPKPG